MSIKVGNVIDSVQNKQDTVLDNLDDNLNYHIVDNNRLYNNPKKYYPIFGKFKGKFTIGTNDLPLIKDLKLVFVSDIVFDIKYTLDNDFPQLMIIRANSELLDSDYIIFDSGASSSILLTSVKKYNDLTIFQGNYIS